MRLCLCCCADNTAPQHRPLTGLSPTQEPKADEAEVDEDEALAARRAEQAERERVLKQSVVKFNSHAGSGIAHLLGHGLLTTPEDVAHFLV